METFNEIFRGRTKRFALDVLKILKVKSESDAFRMMARQLMRCATSVAANFRAACRHKSQKDYVHKLNIVIEECDESVFWLEMLSESGELSEKLTNLLIREADELTAVFSKVKSSAIQRLK